MARTTNCVQGRGRDSPSGIERMNKYQEGKIYKITSEKTEQVYVGSTVHSMMYRFAAHERLYKRQQEGKGKRKDKVTSFLILQHGDAKIELVESFPCETRKELLERELHWILTLPTVNKQRGASTIDQAGYKKAYFKANRDKLDEYNKRVITCECGMTSTYRHLAKHRRTQRHTSWVDLNTPAE